MAKPKLGKSYECIKDVLGLKEGDPKEYIKGKVYKSEIKGCITTEYGLELHYWNDDKYDAGGSPYPYTFSEVFKEVKEINE